jgi:septal ring factor EnvC (AmiA/AmiB activator)
VRQRHAPRVEPRKAATTSWLWCWPSVWPTHSSTIEHADRNEIADLNAEINDLKEEIAEANQTIRYLENELENVK